MTVITVPGGSGTVSAASGGKVYPFSNIGNVAPVQVLAINPARRKITFHNPGTDDTLVYPQLTGTGVVNAPTPASPGGGFRVFGNGGTLIIEGECQGAWSALNFTTVNQPLTVMESNV